MKRVLALFGVASGAIACAQLLSYDQYTERTPDAAIAGDVAGEVDTSVDDAPTTAATLPLRPAGQAKPSGKGKSLWLAIKHLYVGSTDSLLKTHPDAWKEWGLDLDSVCTSMDDSVANIGTCKRPMEAKQDFLVDGLRCRDNNFGHHVVALLNLSSEGFERRLNEGILEGTSTWIVRLDDLDEGADDPYVPGRLYRTTADKAVMLKWDGTDVRKILADSVIDHDLEKPFTAFPKGYLANNTWVSGEPELKTIVLPASASLFVPLTLDSTQVGVTLDAAHTTGKNGVIAGALPIKTIASLLDPIAKQSGFCPGTTLYNSLLKSVQRFPDVVIGAPNLQNTAVECDGISLGFGFDPAPVKPATEIVDPPPPEKDPCTDGGVDTGAPDTFMPDTFMPDTFKPDTAVTDTKSDATDSG
jgi:hypothetical protein